MADKQITPFQLTDQFTMDNFNQRINETNIALQSKPNPNLLDNPYFGNPVDQRGGYVVPPGTTYYYAGGGTVAGTTAAYYTVKSIDTNGNATFAIDGTDYWCNGKGVRGYTSAGYGIDRWKLNGVDNGVPVYLVDTHELINNSTSGYAQTVQIIPYDFAKNFVGKTVTMSVLFDDGFSGETFFELQEFNTWTRIAFQSVTAVNQVVSVTFTMPSISNNIQFYVGTRGNCKPIAAKLELGSQQTLAHQDADGNWVLNEIPDYGEQLARCQRYFRRIKAKQVYSSGVMFSFPIVDVGGATWANINVILSTMMRDAKPSVSFHGLSVADYVSTQSRGSISDNAERNVIYYTGDTVKLSINTGITLTDTDAIMMASEGYIDIINDL